MTSNSPAHDPWLPRLQRAGWSRGDVCITRPLAPGSGLVVAFGQDRGHRTAYLTRVAAEDLDLDLLEADGVLGLASRDGASAWGELVVCAGEDGAPDARLLSAEGDAFTASGLLDRELLAAAGRTFGGDVLWVSAPASTHLLASDDPVALGALAAEIHACAGAAALSPEVLRVQHGLVVGVERRELRSSTTSRLVAAA
jgi:hypothetical protein